MTACLSHCREAPALLLQLCSDAKEDTQLCKIRQRGCPMSVWGRGSGCQVAGSQRGTARRGLCSSAAPAADPVPPNRIYFTIFHPRTSFVLVWWAQLGAAVQQQDTQHTSCIRMYHFSPCIEMHHGFLMRGCILGVVLVCRVLMSTEDEMHRLATCVVFDAHALPAAMSAVLLTWPACYLVHLLLEVNFGLQLVHDNAALLTLVVPHIALTLAMLSRRILNCPFRSVS